MTSNADEIRSKISEIAENWAKAMVSNDADAIGRSMSDSWAIVGPRGSYARLDGNSKRAPYRSSGDVATLTARVTNSGHFRGMPFSDDEWTTDVFKLVGKEWVCTLSHVTPAADDR